jgi:hypothetical protein
VADPGLKMEVLQALTETYAAGRPFPPVEAASAARCTVVEINIDSIEGKRNIDRTEV